MINKKIPPTLRQQDRGYIEARCDTPSHRKHIVSHPAEFFNRVFLYLFLKASNSTGLKNEMHPTNCQVHLAVLFCAYALPLNGLLYE